MKKAYKQANRPMGVYRVRTPYDETVYIGYATDLEARFNRHRTEFKFKNHRNNELQKIWNLYGESALEFEILDVLEQEENEPENPTAELQLLTDMWVQKLAETGVTIVCL